MNKTANPNSAAQVQAAMLHFMGRLYNYKQIKQNMSAEELKKWASFFGFSSVAPLVVILLSPMDGDLKPFELFLQVCGPISPEMEYEGCPIEAYLALAGPGAVKIACSSGFQFKNKPGPYTAWEFVAPWHETEAGWDPLVMESTYLFIMAGGRPTEMPLEADKLKGPHRKFLETYRMPRNFGEHATKIFDILSPAVRQDEEASKTAIKAFRDSKKGIGIFCSFAPSALKKILEKVVLFSLYAGNNHPLKALNIIDYPFENEALKRAQLELRSKTASAGKAAVGAAQPGTGHKREPAKP